MRKVAKPKQQDLAKTLKRLEAQVANVNEARKEIGLPPLSAKLRTCIQCRGPFASIEARTCEPCINKRETE